jgi:glutamyl-tRNA reductase
MSHLVVCGFNYNSSPLTIREKFAIPESCVKHALRMLSEYPEIQESVLLSTCNRTEVYAVVTDLEAGLKRLNEFFSHVRQIADHESLKPNFRLIRDDVCLHLLRVAAGLNSMVFGEAQIIAQIKKAHEAASQTGNSGVILNRLFQLALETGKRVRMETSIGRRAMSISSVAVELAKKLIKLDENFEVTVVGAGTMAQECIWHLQKVKQANPLAVLNRSAGKLDELQKQYGERVKTDSEFSAIANRVAKSRLVLVATNAPEYVIKYDELVAALESNDARRDLLIVDLSVPRNVDPRIATITGVTLKHAEDLSHILSRNKEERQALSGEAEAIVFEMCERFQDWQNTRAVVPTIVKMRQRLESIRQNQLLKQNCFTGGADEDTISRVVVNQILHGPTVGLKSTRSRKLQRRRAELLEELFELNS